jgi:hypothetical protein
MTVNRNCWWRIPICAGVLVLVFLALAPPAGPWKFRTHGGVYGTRGIAKVVYDRIMGDPAVPAGVKENLVWDVIRPGSVIPDKLRMEPYFLDSRHLMTYVENQGSEWLLEVDNLRGLWDTRDVSENVSYYLGIASHYWADITNYSHHDNARLYFENLYGEDAGYEIWDSYHDHLEWQVEFYRPKDPALIVSPGAPAVDYSYVADEPDPLVDGSSRIGSGTGPANTQDSNYDGDNEQISEGNIAGATYTYVTGETVTEGGTTGISGAQADDGTYENIYENDYGAAGGPENRAVDEKDSADDTGSSLTDAQSDDGTTYEVPKGSTMHFDSINTSGAGGNLTKAVLWVQFSVDTGYGGTENIEWAIDEANFSSTGIKPDDGDTDRIENYDLLAQGVDTVTELEALDIRFYNDDPLGPDSVFFDYVWVEAMWTGAPVYRENVQHNITGIPVAPDNTLQIEYYTAGDSEAVSIYIYNFANNTWDNAGTLQGGTEASPNLFENNIDSDHISGGEVRVRYVQPDDDSTQTSLMVDYCRVATVTPDYRLNWEHRIAGVNPARDNYTLRIYGRNDTGDENVGVYIWNDGLEPDDWEFIDNLPLADDWITFFIPAENINNYLDAGNNLRIRYFEDSSDTTQTTIFLDVVVLDENYAPAAGDPYTDLDAFLQDARVEIRKFIDNTMPPNDPMGGWFGDWIGSRKCESSDYSEYAGNPGADVHYGSKELVDMATELVYSGWVYALDIQDDVSADPITWDQWWSRSHREPGVCYVGF